MPLHLGLVCLRCSDCVLAYVCIRCSDGLSPRSRVLALFLFALAFVFSPVTLLLVPFATCGLAADDRAPSGLALLARAPLHGWYREGGKPGATIVIMKARDYSARWLWQR